MNFSPDPEKTSCETVATPARVSGTPALTLTPTAWTVVATRDYSAREAPWRWLTDSLEEEMDLKHAVRAGTVLQAQRKVGDGVWELVMRLPRAPYAAVSARVDGWTGGKDRG